jgi:soluble lytic murein transglycosylase
LTYYKGNLVLAIAAYNAGPEAVDRWLRQSEDWDLDEFVENIPYDQTRQYVGKVLVNMDMYHRLYGVGGKGLSLDVDAELPKPAQGMEMF